MADPNANVNTSNPDSNEALKMLEQYRPSEQPSPTSPGSPQAAVVAEPVESQPTKVDLATEPTVVQAVEVPVNATPVMVNPQNGTMVINEKFIGGGTCCLVILCVVLIGPLGLLFLCCPIDQRVVTIGPNGERIAAAQV